MPHIPSNPPPDIQAQARQQVLSEFAVHHMLPVGNRIVQAVIENPGMFNHVVTAVSIFGTRGPESEIRHDTVAIRTG